MSFFSLSLKLEGTRWDTKCEDTLIIVYYRGWGRERDRREQEEEGSERVREEEEEGTSKHMEVLTSKGELMHAY